MLRTIMNPTPAINRTLTSPPAYGLLQAWLILVGVVGFTAFLARDFGIIDELLSQDATRLCLLIMLALIGASLHCGARSLWLSREIRRFDEIEGAQVEGPGLQLDYEGELASGDRRLPGSLCADYLAGLLVRRQRDGLSSPEYSQLTDVLNERIRGAHEFGWFVTGLLVKLGLLGTVIGFIIMLGAVDSAGSFDVAAVQQLLGSMSEGMSVALYTTLTGLSASMLLGLQYLMLDRAADSLLARVVHFAERRLAV